MRLAKEGEKTGERERGAESLPKSPSLVCWTAAREPAEAASFLSLTAGQVTSSSVCRLQSATRGAWKRRAFPPLRWRELAPFFLPLPAGPSSRSFSFDSGGLLPGSPSSQVKREGRRRRESRRAERRGGWARERLPRVAGCRAERRDSACAAASSVLHTKEPASPEPFAAGGGEPGEEQTGGAAAPASQPPEPAPLSSSPTPCWLLPDHLCTARLREDARGGRKAEDEAGRERKVRWLLAGCTL